MNSTRRSLSPSEAARRLGVSTKALRLYEQRGLISPGRTQGGWRAYSPADMETAAEIIALRALGLSLGQVKRVLDGDADCFEAALASHQQSLAQQIEKLQDAAAKVSILRAEVRSGNAKSPHNLAQLVRPDASPAAVFELPWPWGGERFDVRNVRAINYIIGPLGSGKTRFARRLAQELPNAAFLDMEGRTDGSTELCADLQQHPELKARVDAALTWLIDEGAEVTDALVTLLTGLEDDKPAALIVDIIEHGLSERTQEAVMAYLRRRGPEARPLFILTRSSAILDMDDVDADETIIFCPPNHAPPMYVLPHRGAPGYEAVSLCLASPSVRARTEGVVAIRVGAQA